MNRIEFNILLVFFKKKPRHVFVGGQQTRHLLRRPLFCCNPMQQSFPAKADPSKDRTKKLKSKEQSRSEVLFKFGQKCPSIKSRFVFNTKFLCQMAPLKKDKF